MPKKSRRVSKPKGRNDKPISSRTKKLIFQESNSSCAFCNNSDIDVLHIHHIQGRASAGPNDPQNLILVCANCHAQIEAGTISQNQVYEQKITLLYMVKPDPIVRDPNESSIQVFSQEPVRDLHSTLVSLFAHAKDHIVEDNYNDVQQTLQLLRQKVQRYTIEIPEELANSLTALADLFHGILIKSAFAFSIQNAYGRERKPKEWTDSRTEVYHTLHGEAQALRKSIESQMRDIMLPGAGML